MISQRERLALHKSIQRVLARQIGFDKVKIEHPFPDHYADLYWPEQKIIFEIQCTPISLKEVLKRNRDYENLGLNVVWILHQKSFNKSYLGPAERYLRTRNCLYTNIFTNETGLIYDQDEVIDGHLRVYQSPPYAVDITKPQTISWARTFICRCQIDALYTEGKRNISFGGDRHQRPFWNKMDLLHRACLLKPPHKKIEKDKSSLTKFLFLVLKIGHLFAVTFLSLLLRWKNGRGNFLRNKSNRAHSLRR